MEISPKQKKYEHISLRLQADLFKFIEDISQNQKCTRSEVIRAIIRAFKEQHTGK